MRFLHVIRNWQGNDKTVDLYITDSGEYVLEGDLYSIKLKFKGKSKSVSSVIDAIAYIINIYENYEYGSPKNDQDFAVYFSEDTHIISTLSVLFMSIKTETYLMWGEKDEDQT